MKSLLVEDNPGDARLIRAFFEDDADAAVGLLHVERLSEALDVLVRERVDVVLLDLGLPDSQGLDTFASLRAVAPATPVVVLTGLDDIELSLRALREGAQDYLLKGQVDEKMLMRSLRYAIERKRVEERLKEYSDKLEQMVNERTRDLKEAQEQLLRREKLALLGQLAGSVGHELRNPLGAIKNAAYFLRMVLEGADGEVVETLDIIDQEIAMSDRIIGSLLDFARTKAPVKRKTDLNHVVRTAIDRAAVPEDVELRSELAESLPAVMADPDQLAQVFQNIVSNALHAMLDGGRLLVRSREVSETAAGSGEGGTQGDEGAPSGWLRVTIEDTGSGIAEEDVIRVFEPLFTTKAKGIGLGLPLAKTLVEANGGRIELRSELYKGSSFTVSLPLSGKGAGSDAATIG